MCTYYFYFIGLGQLAMSELIPHPHGLKLLLKLAVLQGCGCLGHLHLLGARAGHVPKALTPPPGQLFRRAVHVRLHLPCLRQLFRRTACIRLHLLCLRQLQACSAHVAASRVCCCKPRLLNPQSGL